MQACVANIYDPLGKPETHHTDHLVPYCWLLDIPLIVTDKAHFEWIETHYPDIEVEHEHPDELTIEYWMAKYDLLIRTYIWDMQQVWRASEALETKYGRQFRTVHCPHGWSDKDYWFRRMRTEDLLFLYGPLMEDMVKQQGVDKTVTATITVGNPRWDYYQAHKDFFLSEVEEEVFSRFEKEQPTVLYAPTWNDSMQVSSFFQAIQSVIEAKPPGVNLLVKLHPRLEDFDQLQTYEIMGQYHQHGEIQFLSAYPYVLPLLERVDLYVGDYSSVGYDFLSFDKPMVFLNQMEYVSNTDRRTLLYQCGQEVLPRDYPQLSAILQEALSGGQRELSKKRQNLHRQAFAPTIDRDVLWNYLEDQIHRGRPPIGIPSS